MKLSWTGCFISLMSKIRRAKAECNCCNKSPESHVGQAMSLSLFSMVNVFDEREDVITMESIGIVPCSLGISKR